MGTDGQIATPKFSVRVRKMLQFLMLLGTISSIIIAELTRRDCRVYELLCLTYSFRLLSGQVELMHGACITSTSQQPVHVFGCGQALLVLVLSSGPCSVSAQPRCYRPAAASLAKLFLPASGESSGSDGTRGCEQRLGGRTAPWTSAKRRLLEKDFRSLLLQANRRVQSNV